MLAARWTSIFGVVILQIAGFLLFAKGFFPKKLVLPGYGEYFDADEPVPHAKFNKLVFMVVDALRSDFVFSEMSDMQFVQQLIAQGYGLPFTAHSTPPTVTLPRLKGLTTGSTPNFLDAILNIAEDDTSSTLAGQDSWIKQLKDVKNSTIHMFGDDTWIKLFPGMFDVSDGTSSFFVSDYTEVDNNVTRHLDDELSRKEWDVLILHYLGLDHIGHKGGPQSPFMPQKQREMDQIVQKLYENIDDDTLLVLCGDHGMNEVGNHGGSSAGETSAALTLLSPKFSSLPEKRTSPIEASDDYNYYDRISQADLVPTLAALLGFPIPQNSLGVIRPEILQLWKSKNERIGLLQQNVLQIAHILETTYPTRFRESSSEDDTVGDLYRTYKLVLENFSEEVAYKFLVGAQSFLSRASSNYDIKTMVHAVIAMIGASGVSLSAFLAIKSPSTTLKRVLVIVSTLYGASMFGSSLVEEEHHFWFWGATGWVAWSFIIESRKKFKNGTNWVICLIIIRIIRGWNQTGQKYAGAPDIAKYLEMEDHANLLWSMIGLYYGSLLERLWKGPFGALPSMGGFVVSFTTVIASLVFKLNMAFHSGEPLPALAQHFITDHADDTQLASLARFSFLTIFLGVLYELSQILLGVGEEKANVHPLTNLSYVVEVFLVTQSRSRNIPIFIFFNLMRTYLRKSSWDVTGASIFIFILQHVSFFALGNSNSLASLDLSNAYNGVRSYDIVKVGVLTFLSNWVGPIYWSMAGLSILLESQTFRLRSSQQNARNAIREDVISHKILASQVFFSIGSAGVMGACLLLKDHLFIWTVFSPKLLYAASWVIIQHVFLDIILTVILALLF
uniref:GPI ethanolamine phosphate transferase 2 n=1 Tax=Blastobotrys adeninivorans TaxID=409370 RepID=A0A060T0D6_BLAAD